MSSDLIGRRRASEQRLDRARSLELALKEKTDLLVETTGMPIEQLDFDGSFRAALTALAAVASRRTHFDVILTLPDAPFAMRIQHVNNAVSAEVLIQRDGPFEPVSDSGPLAESAAGPNSGRQEPDLAAATFAATQPGYATPVHPMPVYATGTQPSYVTPSQPAQPAYATTSQPTYTPAASGASPMPDYANPDYANPDYANPGPPAVGYVEPTYTISPPSTPVRPMRPAPAAPLPSFIPSAYAASPTMHSESSGSAHAISVEPQPNSAGEQPVSGGEEPPMVQVASDLAALLWQGMDDMPS